MTASDYIAGSVIAALVIGGIIWRVSGHKGGHRK